MRKRPATYADLEAAPDHLTAEIIGGALVLTPKGAEPHVRTASVAGGEIGFRYDHGDGPGGWVVLFEPELWLGSPDPRDEVLVPDLAAWRRDRYAAPEGVVGFEVRPDWVCEVLSPSTARRDRLHKLGIYARERIAHAWLVDPVEQTIEVYELREGVYALIQAIADVPEAEIAPFVGAPLRVARWWSTAVAAR